MRIAEATGLNVVMGNGYYVYGTHPDDMETRPEDDLVEEMALSLRFVGDDATYAERKSQWRLNPPFDVGLKHGDPFPADHELYPQVFPPLPGPIWSRGFRAETTENNTEAVYTRISQVTASPDA